MTYRIIQWSTGNVGTAALRCIIRHPELELVGVWVHSTDKAGKEHLSWRVTIERHSWEPGHDRFVTSWRGEFQHTPLGWAEVA